MPGMLALLMLACCNPLDAQRAKDNAAAWVGEGRVKGCVRVREWLTGSVYYACDVQGKLGDAAKIRCTNDGCVE